MNSLLSLPATLLPYPHARALAEMLSAPIGVDSTFTQLAVNVPVDVTAGFYRRRAYMKGQGRLLDRSTPLGSVPSPSYQDGEGTYRTELYKAKSDVIAAYLAAPANAHIPGAAAQAISDAFTDLINTSFRTRNAVMAASLFTGETLVGPSGNTLNPGGLQWAPESRGNLGAANVFSAPTITGTEIALTGFGGASRQFDNVSANIIDTIHVLINRHRKMCGFSPNYMFVDRAVLHAMMTNPTFTSLLPDNVPRVYRSTGEIAQMFTINGTSLQVVVYEGMSLSSTAGLAYDPTLKITSDSMDYVNGVMKNSSAGNLLLMYIAPNANAVRYEAGIPILSADTPFYNFELQAPSIPGPDGQPLRLPYGSMIWDTLPQSGLGQYIWQESFCPVVNNSRFATHLTGVVGNTFAQAYS